MVSKLKRIFCSIFIFIFVFSFNISLKPIEFKNINSSPISISVKSANALFGVGDIVFDPAVYIETLLDFLETAYQTVQNELDAVQQTLQSYESIQQTIELITQTYNQLKMLANQLQGLENDYEMIANQYATLERWYENLAHLEPGDLLSFLEGLAADLDAIQTEMIENSRGFVKDYENVDQQYDDLFDAYGEPLTGTELSEKNAEYNDILHRTAYDTTKTAKILANSAVDAEEITDAMYKVNNAEGTVGVLQGMSGLEVVKARQGAEMRYLMVALNQQLGVQAAAEANELEQGRKDVGRYYEESTEITEIEVRTIEDLGATGF